jgi:hypothetical protein
MHQWRNHLYNLALAILLTAIFFAALVAGHLLSTHFRGW